MSFTTLATELLHMIALSGHLTTSDVCALALTCSRFASVFTCDRYARHLHQALRGVVPNVYAKNWVSARYALTRRLFGESEESEESVWRGVAEAVVGSGKVELKKDSDLEEWENVLLSALALPSARGCLDEWYRPDGPYPEEILTSLLHIAASVGSENLVNWVLEKNAPVDTWNYRSATPLWEACKAGHLGVVTKLVEAGADVTTRDEQASNLLIAASQSGNVDVVRFLLNLDAVDMDEEDYHGNTPLRVACHKEDVDVATLLIEKGAYTQNVSASLFWAVENGSHGMVRILISGGVWDSTPKDGGIWVRALGCAARNGHAKVVRLLLGVGVAVNTLDRSGDTALLDASRHGHVDVVNALLQAGADAEIANRRGEAPLGVAREGGHDSVVELLQEASRQTR